MDVRGFLNALAAMKRYTPADATIRGGMLRATLGFDPFSQQGRESIPLPIGGMRGGRFAGKGPLELFGPKPDSLVAPFRQRKLQEALARNMMAQVRRERSKIPTGISAQAAAARRRKLDR